MILAVAMMFIDQTIVSLAIPSLSGELTLSSTGAQWIVNGYLLSLAAFFILGGKLADTLGHRKMLYVGVTGFAVCSALCGATPTGSGGEAWIIFFRIAQGVRPVKAASQRSHLHVKPSGFGENLLTLSLVCSKGE